MLCLLQSLQNTSTDELNRNLEEMEENFTQTTELP